jgi:hypothetical protein
MSLDTKKDPASGEGNDTGSNQATLLSDHVLSDPATWLF